MLTVFAWTCAILAVIVLGAAAALASGLLDRLAGTGDRRMTRRARVAQQRDEIAALKERLAKYEDEDGLPTAETLAAADALDTTPRFDQPALADTPGAWTSIPDATPSSPDHLLTELCDDKTLALPTVAPVADVEKTQVMSVAQVRNAVAAAAPVRLDPVPPVTWPRKARDTAQIEAALSLPGPPPGAGASEISMATGLKAVTQVHAIVTEAAS